MIRDYRGLKIEYDDLHSQSMTANASGTRGGGGNHRAIESIVLRELSADDQKAYDAVTQAIGLTELMPDGMHRLKLIRYVYWCEKQHNVKDAALLIPVSRRTAERWHSAFVRLVGSCYGFEVGGLEPKEYAKIIESK